MGSCCSIGVVGGGGVGKKKTPTGSSLTPFEDFSSLSTRSKKSTAEKLETVTEEKENQGSPQQPHRHGPTDGRKSPHGGSPKVGRGGSTRGQRTCETRAR
jgi:hypothetical protein